MMQRTIYLIMIISMLSLVSSSAYAQLSYKPDEVRMTLDYTKYKSGVSLSGPAFGVSWLMQNRFMNTFDFAVAKNKNLDNEFFSQKAVTLRYQVLYMPKNTLGKIKTGIGLGVDRRIDKGNGHLGLNMLGKIKYPFAQSYFVELIVPYNLYYKSFGDIGIENEIQESEFRTFKGLDLKTKRLSTVRVGIGVSF